MKILELVRSNKKWDIMYKLSLRPNQNNPFQNQMIFWYPLLITPHGSLISFNIATNENFEHLDKLSNKGYVLSTYKLDQENICFIYQGKKIEKLIENFGERSFITDDGSINYFFPEKELKYICKKIYDKKDSDEIEIENLEHITINELSKRFGEEWKINLTNIEKPYKYSTDLTLPNPIVQLVHYTNNEKFEKKYYKEMLIYLLRRDFLVLWVNSVDMPANLRRDILNKYNELSNERKNDSYLDIVIRNIVTDLFNKYEIFRIVYLTSQCGSGNSILKLMMNNLYSILPSRDQDHITIGCINFQPKIVVKSVELHFITNTDYEWQLIQIYECLKEISKKVKFYDIAQHKMLDNEELIRRAMKHHHVENRYRFISEISITPAIDYSELHLKVSELTDAIIAILNKRYLSYGNYSVSLKELWVKKIGLRILTPPQFEDEVKYSLSQKWIIDHLDKNDRISKNDGAKTMYIDLSCDYPVFMSDEFSFSFDYTRDIQYVYSILNDELKHKHNFDSFSLNFSRERKVSKEK